MGFIIKKRESYRWTVEHPIEVRDGKPVSVNFDAEFKALPQSKVKETMDAVLSGKLKDDEFVSSVVVGWRGLEDENGAPVQFGAEALRELCEAYPGMTGSITAAWVVSVSGGAARKN